MDMDFGDRTAIEEVLEHLVRRVRVDMHLIDRRVADAQLAIAHRLEEVERCVLVEIIRVNEEFVAVGVIRTLDVYKRQL